MKTRVFAIGLILMFITSMAVFAGGISDTRAPARPDGLTTITVWSNDAHDKAQMDSLIAQYNNTTGRDKGIRIEYSVYGADWNTAINMALETNRAPDMFKGGFANADAFQAQGRFLPWTEIPGIQDILDAQAPFHRNLSSTFGGVPYGVVVYGNIPGFHYNKDLVQRAGFSGPPKTWAELEQQAIAISRLSPEVYGIGIPLLWAPDFCHWVTEFAAASSLGKMYWNFAEGRYEFEAFTEYFEMLSRVREANAIFPGMESLTDDQLRAHFANGTVGFIWGASWNVGVLYDQFPFGGGASGNPNNPEGWDFAPFPLRDASVQYATPFSASVFHYVNVNVRNDPYKLAAMQDVIRLFSGPDTQRIMYSLGLRLPINTAISSTATTAARSQWTSVGQTADRFVTMPSAPHNMIAVEGADRAAIIAQILTGQIPATGIRAALADLDRRMNAAFAQAVQRGQIRRDDYVDPTFQSRLGARN